MANTNPIGLFDSGVGGLSVLQEIKKILPLENLIFLADQAHVPYGAKTKSQLNKLTEKITEFLLEKDIKMLVVACNTATCYSLGHLRKKFKIPIVGVVPAIRPAIALTKQDKIAILSTPATAKSLYLKKLISQFAQNIKVLNLGCSGLEDSVEKLNYIKINSLLSKYTKVVKKSGADVIILGCTHYPFLKGDIEKMAGKNVKVIDSGKAIAKRVKNLLGESQSLSNKKLKDLYFTTSKPQEFTRVASILLNHKITSFKANI